MNASSDLPLPDADAAADSAALEQKIISLITEAGGCIPFSRYMETVLYDPQYGYYSGGTQKFGAGGDFVTAPVLTPLFARTLAVQLEALLPQTAGCLYEFGAGDGRLAADLLNTLPPALVKQYCIVEVSPVLAERQKEHIRLHAPAHADKVVHLQELPEALDGVVLGNEVLDAMPVGLYRREDTRVEQAVVKHTDTGFISDYQAEPSAAVCAEVLALFPDVPGGYVSELHRQQYAFTATLARKLTRGALIFADYGYGAPLYYHPQRRTGTLTGHYRHHIVHDPFFCPGLTDLTAHVNFTRIADAGLDNGLELIGYTTQASFLLNLGITRFLEETGKPESPEFIRAAAACHTLLDNRSMGEIFKMMALGKNIGEDWQGFQTGDLCHTL